MASTREEGWDEAACDGCDEVAWLLPFTTSMPWGQDQVWLCAACAGLKEGE